MPSRNGRNRVKREPKIMPSHIGAYIRHPALTLNDIMNREQ